MSDSTSQAESITSNPPKKQHLTKKRIIKKDRVVGHAQDGDERINNKLTKEERALIQKEKNREAAQRSRDQHREYVTNLEREVKELREELQKARHYCFRCQGEIGANVQANYFDIHQEEHVAESSFMPSISDEDIEQEHN